MSNSNKFTLECLQSINCPSALIGRIVNGETVKNFTDRVILIEYCTDSGSKVLQIDEFMASLTSDDFFIGEDTSQVGGIKELGGFISISRGTKGYVQISIKSD
jgi:hypothetical protein